MYSFYSTWGRMVLKILFLIFIWVDFGICLNKYVDQFETLNYRPVLDRRKRSTDEPASPIDLRFRSHNRTFHLKLTPIEPYADIFSDNHLLDVNGEYQSHVIKPHQFLYNGYVKDDPASHVHGSVLDGIFDGHVHLGDGTVFTIEKAARYFQLEDRPQHYHSIIYPDTEINHVKFREKRNVEDNFIHKEEEVETDHTCGLSKSIHSVMEKIQTSAVPPFDQNFYEPVQRSHLLPHDDFHFHSFSNNNSRSKRDISITFQQPQYKEINNQRLFTVRTCSIYLQADQKLYEHIFYKEGNRDHVRTREEIVSLFYNHIKAVNQIYETTDFGGILGLNFVIQRTTIYTKETCQGNKPAPGSDNPFCEENVDVSNFLNLNSQKNHSAFCLAYALTFRDFVGGTLGLAWVASPNFNTAGGICQVYQKYNEGSRGMVYRSLNTGIVSLINYGNRVPSRVSQLTLAHEIGHNFGSPHDFPLECQPGLPDGNYIMFASATSGDKVNNARFSPCSVANISLVLYEVLSQSPVDPQHSFMAIFGKKRNCFQERTSAFCGNQIREPGEECDCGFSDRDCQQMADHCCTPHEIGGRFYGSNACKRRPTARCSPSEGQCCNGAQCSFYSARENRVCRDESECLYSQTCDGRGPECPDSQPKPDGLPCQDATKVCQSGSCNGSICAQVGLKDCFLTDGKPSELCHLACEKSGKCLSSFELLEFGIGKFPQTGREDKSGLLLHPGSPCNNYKGYCDIFRKCRSVDSNGPLARLKNLLFNKQTISTVSQWAQEHWWACVLMGIGVLFFMAVFVKCCAVHTPSTNPNKLPAQHFSETLRHPGTLLRRGRHRPQAYSVAVAGQPPPPTAVVAQPSATGGGPAARTARNQQRQRQQQRASSSNQHNRVPANLSAPPLIPQTSPTAPTGTNETSTPLPAVPQNPPPSVAPPVSNEPPPPYTPIDPSSSVVEALPAAAMVVPPVPVPLPGPPGPAIPSVIGPPLGIPGGPKAGRRKNQKPSGKDGKKEEKKPQKKK